MSLYVVCGVTIVVAVLAIAFCLREKNWERAETYPLGSSERRALEGGARGRLEAPTVRGITP